MSTKIVPKSSVPAATAQGETKRPSLCRLPSKRISSQASAKVSKFMVDHMNTTPDATAAYVDNLQMVEEADSLNEARNKVETVVLVMEKLKLAAEAAEAAEAATTTDTANTTTSTTTTLTTPATTTLQIALVDLQTILTALDDYKKIKVEHDQLVTQNKNTVAAESQLLERMQRVLLATLDKQAIASIFMAFGANPTKRRRSGKHRSMLGRTASQVAIAAQHDSVFNEAVKLFPSDPEKVLQGKQLLSDANDWSKFNIWKLRSLFDNDNILTSKALVTYVFEDALDLLSTVIIDGATFSRWVNAVCNTYKAVPYHK